MTPQEAYDMGRCYETGRDVDKDEKKAFQYYMYAAGLGHAAAQNKAGMFYSDGRGVVQDDAAAFVWFQKSAAQGSRAGIYNLGWCYANGRGTEKDAKMAFQYYLRAAELGDADAQNKVGNLYLDGRGIARDDAAGFGWFLKSAAQNHASGNYNAGWCCANGRGTAKDAQKAFQYFLRAAGLGSANGQWRAGNGYHDGIGTARNYAEAVKWYEKAAARNHPNAVYSLGRCYEQGHGVEKSGTKAFRHYLRAAELGHAEGQWRTGNCCCNGYGTARNYAEAIKWYEKAAAQDLPAAMYELGRRYQDGEGTQKDDKKAFDYYLRAARLGHAGAQNMAGMFFSKGRGTEKDDAAAFEWYRKSAAQDDLNGNYNLAWCYANGRGVAKDEEKAFRYYLHAAELGDEDAQNMVGQFYLDGIGVRQDYAKAVEWYKKAIDQGQNSAVNNLGYCYENGYGVEQNREKALELYERAAAMGSEVAKENAENLRARLNEEPEAPQQTPPPVKDAGTMSALEELRAMIGLGRVKREVERIVRMHRINEEKRRLGISVPDMSLHMVFTGNPGTGKTTVARLIGKIYHELGLLKNDRVKEVKRDDLVGKYVGETALLTKQAIEDAKGGILFVDEAYTLTPEDAKNDFGREAVTTLLAEMENHRDDLVVIVAGYTREMKRFIDSNPGLSSRFGTKIEFDDYTAADMQQIFEKMVRSDGYVLEEGADALLDRYFDWAVRTRTKNFGNAREVRNFYEEVTRRSADRLSAMERYTREDLITFRCSDIRQAMEEKMGRLDEDGDPLQELDAMIGLESVKEAVRSLRDTAQYYRMCISSGVKPPAHPAMHMVFAGNPGTGKTTVARLIGQIYHSLGLLPTREVTEVKREDLVGKYVGETALKTREVIERALGGVLFIDEAYTLNAEGSPNDFGREAVNTLLAEMENNRENLAVIVAGYNDEMERFLRTNPGLRSRFTTRIRFEDYTGAELAAIFRAFAKNNTFGEGAEGELHRICNEMYENRDKNFGNGRDVRNFFDAVNSCMAKRLVRQRETLAGKLMQITREDLLEAEQRRRGNEHPGPKGPGKIGF